MFKWKGSQNDEYLNQGWRMFQIDNGSDIMNVWYRLYSRWGYTN